MARLRYNGLSTTLGGSLTNSATSVTFSAALTYQGGTAVPTITGSDYIPLEILDSTGKLSEIVYLTAYTTAGTTGTITRGQEGTTGVSHASGDKVTHGPTVADMIAVTAWTNLTLASGFVSHADNFGYPPQYRLVGDRVELRGLVRRSSGSFSTTGLVIGTLPVGFRPPRGPAGTLLGDATVDAAVYRGSAGTSAISVRVQVDVTGDIQIAAAASCSWASIACDFSLV